MALTKTLQQMANQVGKTIKYYDGSTWKTSRDVTEADIKEYINLLYQDEVFPMFANEYPRYFKEIGYFDSWIATGVASTGLSGSTLVATTGIFTSAMADQKLYVYNSTLGETTSITAYTNSTTVTVADSDISSWDGSTIWILGQEFSFGGDGTNLWTPLDVRVLYDSSSSDMRVASHTQEEDIFRTGSEVGSKALPEWYDTSVSVDGNLETAIGIWPKMDTKLSKAIRVTYIAKPGDLADGDIPRLPVSLPLIDGATAWAYEQKGGDETRKSMMYWDRYQKRLGLALQNWRPDRTNTPQKIRISKKYLWKKGIYR